MYVSYKQSPAIGTALVMRGAMDLQPRRGSRHAQVINSSRSARCRHTVRRRDYSEGGVLSVATRRDLARPFAVLLGALVRFEGFADFLAPDTEARRIPGTLPIQGSLATMSSQARSAASSKSGASTGRTCQPVTAFPST